LINFRLGVDGVARFYWFRLLGFHDRFSVPRMDDSDSVPATPLDHGHMMQYLLGGAWPPALSITARAAPTITVAADAGTGVQLAIVPVATPTTADEATPTTVVVATPEPDLAAGASARVASLLVAADPLIAAGLIPIQYGPAAPESQIGEGWLATYLMQHPAAPMRIDWDVDALGSAWSDLGLLLGPVLGVVELSGDFSGGFALAELPSLLDQLTLATGNDYDLVADDNCVAAGHALAVDAHALGAGDHVAFDGSAVSEGSFNFLGGSDGDRFFGGGGDDRIEGAGGADMLSGGGGHDIFVYTGTGDSTGTTFDTLVDFDPAEDVIDLPGSVTGLAASVAHGALSLASFNADLAAALGGLGASQAGFFAPDAGDFAGKIFLVVDANGVAGYQAGEDYVFAVTGASLADLTAHGTGIFV
jgi:RTX calcium-binding nonapeptide repeat (4 copies)